MVLAANGKQGLATVALRPSGIFGEWDPLFVPTAVEKAKQGKMKYIVGSGQQYDGVYLCRECCARSCAGKIALRPPIHLAV